MYSDFALTMNAVIDINDESLVAARHNVEHNDLTGRIGLVKTSPQEGFFGAALYAIPL